MSYTFAEANAGTGGPKFPVDLIGSWQYPLSKLTFGAEGTATPVSAADPLPVKFADAQTTVPDNSISAPPVRVVGQDVWACSFTDVLAATLSSDYWVEMAKGTGVSVSQASGNGLIVAGTTANAEYLARSVRSWRGAWCMRYKFIASQRIANTNFAVMLADLVGENLSCTINSATSISVTKTGHGLTAVNVGQAMMVGGITGAAGVPGRYAIASIPDANTINFTVAGWPASGSCTLDLFGHSYVRNLYTSTTATNSAFDAQRKGWNSGDTTATINTTASPGHLAQITNDGRSIYLDDMLVASATTPNVTTRASRVENIPDDNLDLYVFLWSYNGTTAPGSSTTWTVGFVSVERFANTPIFLQGAKAQGTRAPQPVQVTNSISLAANTPTMAAGTNLAGDVGIQYRATATGAGTAFAISSPATNAAASIKAGAGRVLGWYLQNSSAGVRSVKMFNTLQASVTLGTTSAAYEIDIPAGGYAYVQFPGGIAHATAIVWSCSSAKGLTDNTGSVALNDVTGFILYA